MSIFFNEEKSRLFRGADRHLSRAVIITAEGSVYEDTFYGGDNIRMDGSGSSVNYDRFRETRTDASLVFWANGTEAKEVLDPVNRPRIELFGGVLVDGVTEWAPLGKVTVTDWNVVDYKNDYKVSVQASDLSELIRENRWNEPFQVDEGSTFKEAIEDILSDRGNPADHVIWDYSNSEETPGLSYTENDDPWAEIVNLSMTNETEIYFSKNNFLVVEQVLSDDESEIKYFLGGEDFIVEDGRRKFSSSIRNVYNGVIVRGEAPWLLFPISGEYWNDNPASKLNRTDFGERPKVIGSAVATSDSQCDLIAESEYKKIAGIQEQIEFRSTKDPYLSVGDVMGVAGSTTGPRIFTLDRLNFPLGPGTMSGTIRRKV